MESVRTHLFDTHKHIHHSIMMTESTHLEELSVRMEYVRSTATESVDSAYAEELLEVIRSADGSEDSRNRMHMLLIRMFDHQFERDVIPEGFPLEEIRDTILSDFMHILRSDESLDEKHAAFDQAHQRHISFIRKVVFNKI